MTNLMITATRQPFALDAIRKLGRHGHRIVAVDSFEAAPGNHSTYVDRALVTAAPRFDPELFVAQVVRAIDEEDIDVLLPCFEESFYLAKHLDALVTRCDPFLSSFELLARLHDKRRFTELADELGVRVPPTIVATSRAELEEALGAFETYLARPVYSRGGTQLLTNAGDGTGDLDECEPTEAIPWLVQPHVPGEEVCTLSVVRRGQVTAHVTYLHPVVFDVSGGIVFESIQSPETLEVAQRLARATDYHGHMGLDFRRAADGGLALIECNPRATAGLTMMPDAMYEAALFGPIPRRPVVAAAGERRMIGAAVVRDLLTHFGHLGPDLKHLFSPSTKDLFSAAEDPLPALYQFLTLGQVRNYQKWAGEDRDRRKDLVKAYCYDWSWDGQPIP